MSSSGARAARPSTTRRRRCTPLALIGRAYATVDPRYRDGPVLTASLKSTIVGCDLLLTVLLYRLIARRFGALPAQTAALLYWLNPAVILDGAVLGYLDPWAGMLVIAACLFADAAAPWLTGAIMMLAVLTKAQAIFAAPLVALLLARTAPRKTIPRASAAAALVLGLALAPFALRGALPNLVQGVGSLMRHDMLSGTAANLWWIVTWLLRASYAVKDLGAWAAWTMTVRILGISRVVALGYPNPRPVALALVLASFGWACWRARSGGMPEILAAAAFAVHAYFVLGVQVHENHLYLALPLMAGAASVRPLLRGPFIAVSAIFAANLLLFYGIGRGFALPPRTFTVIDATVLLSFANVATLWWHARRFAAVARSGLNQISPRTHPPSTGIVTPVM